MIFVRKGGYCNSVMGWCERAMRVHMRDVVLLGREKELCERLVVGGGGDICGYFNFSLSSLLCLFLTIGYYPSFKYGFSDIMISQIEE